MAPEVLSVVEGAIGPNIGLWSSHFISKPPLTGKRTLGMKIVPIGKGVLTVWMVLLPFGYH